MNIGIDATCWQNNRGYGRHARSLLGALVRLDKANRYTFFMDSDKLVESLPTGAERFRIPTSAPTSEAAAASGRRSLGDMWRVGRTLSSAPLDVLLYPTIYSYVPAFTSAKKLVIIHDIIAETYPELTLPSKAARYAWNAKVAVGRWQADAIVTVSEYSRKGIIRHFNIPPDRVHVVGEAGDPIFRTVANPVLAPQLVSLGLSPAKRMIVYVGGFGPHKNLQALLNAFEQISGKPEFSDATLVMVGEYKSEVFHSYYSTLAEQIERNKLAGRVVFTGYLSDEDLVHLLNLSAVLVLPSLMEGFGLPAVEAAACGCPVIATTESPLPDVLGAGGLYINPHKPEELTAALTRVLGSAELRASLRAAGLAATAKLTWDAAAQQMLAVINTVAKRN
jgi:glycosyltransferase involved in cell wall biosynthesis